MWNYKEIRKDSWNTTFKKGARSWFDLVIVGFIFAFLGASNASQTYFIDILDKFIGADSSMLPGNIEFLKQYILTTPIVKDIPFISSDLVMRIIDSATKSSSWVIRILELNQAYFDRNPGEVLANLLIAALTTTLIHFFIHTTIIVGENRYVMENRFEKNVPLRRTLVVFRKKNLINLWFTMFLYRATLILWSFTIVGGFYKYFQYCMVPYLLAENPQIRWKEAKELSKKMTNGHKMEMFKTWLSYLYIWILKLVPVAGLTVAVPLEATLNAEIYFTLRNSNPADSFFIERSFDQKAYIHNKEDKVDYQLKDFEEINLPEEAESIFKSYSLIDIIYLFFIFSFVGYIWEVGLTLVNQHILANRGTMYGPWIPIYGFGATIMILVLDRYKKSKEKVFVMGVSICAVLEYLSSFLLDFLFNSSYWDYKKMLFNINGRICLAGLVAFGIGGEFAIYIAGPYIKSRIQLMPKKRQYLIAFILVALFIADLVCCMIFGFNSGSQVGGKI